MGLVFTEKESPHTVASIYNLPTATLGYIKSSKRRLLITFVTPPSVWTGKTGYYNFDLAAWVESTYTGWVSQPDKRLHSFAWNPTASELWSVSWVYRYMAKSTDHGATWARWGSYLNRDYAYHLHWLSPYSSGTGCMILGTTNSGGSGVEIWRWTGSAWQSVYDFGGNSKPITFITESDNYLLVCTEQDGSGNMIQRWNGNDLSGRAVVAKYADFSGTPLSIFWDADIGQYLVGASGKIFESNAGETSESGDWVEKCNVANLGSGWTGAYAHCASFIKFLGNIYCLCFMTDNLGVSDPQGWILLKRKSDGSWEIEKHWPTMKEAKSAHIYQDVYYGKTMQWAGIFENKIIIPTNYEE